MAKQISTKWKKNKGFKKPFDYTLEDGSQTVTIRRLDMPDLLKLGIANELDFMSKALMGNSVKDEARAKEIIAEATKEADNLARMETMINKVVVAGVIDPNIYPVPIPADENEIIVRNEEVMYVDEIPWDDRMELFGVIFESEGLSDFREEQEPGVGNVADVQTVQLPADGPMADVPSGDTERVLPQ
ncbi:tail assembly chaperone [Mycobacterium phage Patience]|uniref:Tail assembly chaperone n=1 Tax=Mycobacterium phage Patience TaxID=1074308 RepID=G1JWE3_9CAUD|nr:tail assembly chaperone [Mycobacterium phage Patience]AEL97941.1 tail assembly chaperone [Mycobacterium phage Patience]